jgi:EAL domain-containing protein (putative c-di-GMP-specific phosphodiesterase class I)/GGDEF domain-containing protein
MGNLFDKFRGKLYYLGKADIMGKVKPQKDCSEQLKQAKLEIEQQEDRINQLEQLLNHDPDTGLLQRHILTRRMNQLINSKTGPFAFGILRLDKNYQRIRHTRDRMKVLLYVMVERLLPLTGADNLYQSDRFDEFLFLITDYKNQKEVEEQIQNMIIKVSEPHNPPASDLSFGCNVGVAFYPEHARTLDELEVNAEIALGIYMEKNWNGFLYSSELGEGYYESQSLEFSLRRCILNNFEGFHVVYQPIVDWDKNVVACETLVRWDAPQFGLVPPDKFIPLAESSGLINYLGKWILYKALGQIKIWRKEYDTDLVVSVNISPIQLEQIDFVDTIETSLRIMKVPGSSLHLELTERAVMVNPEETGKKLTRLQSSGIEIMLDDFGTGYSSLSALKTLPINTLKIPKEFVDNILTDSSDLEMVRVILGIARIFGFTTLAEGIEEKEQFDCLINEGCRYIQGYITSSPIDASEFAERFLA